MSIQIQSLIQRDMLSSSLGVGLHNSSDNTQTNSISLFLEINRVDLDTRTVTIPYQPSYKNQYTFKVYEKDILPFYKYIQLICKPRLNDITLQILTL